MSDPTMQTIDDRTLDALVDMLQMASSPESREAQNTLLRQLALEGDITPSRVPPPRNITEVGGYLNLLATLHQPEMRAQALAGVLGVAAPGPPLGWLAGAAPVTFVPFANDRPEGPWQAFIPPSVAVRSDFADGLTAGLKTLHDCGCQLPLLSIRKPLPMAGPGVVPPDDLLPYLGRELWIVPACALRDPASDPVALVRRQNSQDAFEPHTRVLRDTNPVPADQYDALKFDAGGRSQVSIANGKFVKIAPALASAGFYPAGPAVLPDSITSTAWARFTNRTGLVSGTTMLGDELSLLYGPAAINSSVFATRLRWRWNGSTFATD